MKQFDIGTHDKVSQFNRGKKKADTGPRWGT